MPSREGGKGSAEGDELRQRAQVPKSCFTAPSPRAPDRGMAGYAVSRRLLEESLEVANITLTKDDSDQEAVVSLGLFTQIILLFVAMVAGHTLAKYKILWLGEAGVALLLGILVGVIVRFASEEEQFKEVMAFDNEFFFLVLLPPIIFEAAFSLNVEPFLDNIGAICNFAIADTAIPAFTGTLISTLSIGVIMWLAGMANMCYKLTFLEATLFGAIISATDPVTVLSVFNSLGANVDLYSLVFGESVLNDAVAIVLYRTVRAFLDPTNPTSVGRGVLSFFIIFLGSMFIGIAIAIVSSIAFKTGVISSDHGVLEPIFVVLFAFLSYMIGEACSLSGIVSVLFCGMVMAKYTRPNLSSHSVDLAKGFFKILATMSETFVFIYIGTSMCLERQAWDNGMTWAFLVISIVALAISRALNVYPVAAVVNCLRPREVHIPLSHQHMLWFSGLRGAIAFALSLSAATDLQEPGRVMLTTTFFLILFTVLFNGGLAGLLLGRMGLLGGPQGGVFSTRRYAAMQEVSLENEMTRIQKDKPGSMDDAESLLPDGSRRDSLTDVQLLEEENGVNGQHIAGKLSTGHSRTASEPSTPALESPTNGQSSSRGKLHTAVTTAGSKIQNLHNKVREITGQSYSDKLSNIDKKYISKFLVAESSRHGSAHSESGLHESNSTSSLELSNMEKAPLKTSDNTGTSHQASGDASPQGHSGASRAKVAFSGAQKPS